MKMKKLLSVLTAAALSLTMCLSTSILASASTEGTTANVSNPTDFINALDDSTTTQINIMSDIDVNQQKLLQTSKEITINFNGNTVKCSFIFDAVVNLTLKNGILVGSDNSTAIDSSYSGVVISAENMKIFGGDRTVNSPPRSAIYINRAKEVTLDNCYLSTGKSLNGDKSYWSFYVNDTNCTTKVRDCTFEQNAGNPITNDLIEGNITDFDGEPITLTTTENKAKNYSVGMGYLNIVNGNEIKDTDGNAKAQSPTTMTATIPEPTYTVTIPATVDFGTQKQALEKYKNSIKDGNNEDVVVTRDFEITAQNVDHLFKDNDFEDTITVKVTYDGQMTNADSDVKIPYEVKNVPADTTTPIATFKNDVDLTGDETNSVTLTASLNRANLIADGIFTGTMTFTVGQTEKEAG